MSRLSPHRSDPIEVFDALGIGWGVHELYPDPVNQEAFRSAVQRLSVLSGGAITYEIGAGSVSCNGEALEIARGGTARLSLRLFVHEIEWLELRDAPTATDLDELFKLLAADESTIRSNGGIARALQDQKVWSIAVTQRGLLSDLLEKPWEEREGDSESDAGDGGPRASRLARMITAGASPEDVAAAMVAEAAGDTEVIATSFCEAYRFVYPGQETAGVQSESVPELLAAYRQAPKARPPVDTFAEAFFLIPVEAQARILADFLSNRTEGWHSLLLDQFAGIELAELAPHLSEDTFRELLGYARDVVDSDTGSADELLPLVSAARDVKIARRSAADRIREMIEGIGGLGGATGGLAGKLRHETADVEALRRYVVRVLMEVEDRPDRFARFAEAWCDRISSAVQEGQISLALELVRIGTEEADLSPHKRRVIEVELAELLRRDHGVFSAAAQNGDNREQLGDLLAGFGEQGAEFLMERLAMEEDPALRRVLIGLLVVAGSRHTTPISRFFRDPRWYVVRNAVTIAGKIGGERWVPELVSLASHSDHRVVVEVLRALTPIAPDTAVPTLVNSLAHDHARVQETALLLLRASTSPLREAELSRALLDGSMHSVRTEIARLLFQIGTPDATAVLRQIARKPFLISSTRRDARRAARQVLGEAA